MKLLARWLCLPVIIEALPYDIINGTLANADEVMANFNWIVNSVNDNSPVAVANEWQVLDATPTQVGVATFSLVTDYTTTLPPGRALRFLDNGSYLYGWVGTSTYAVGVTTVVVYFRTGNLTADLTEVSYGLLSSTPRSTPVETVVTATRITTPQALVAPSLQTVIFNNTQITGTVIDTLEEFNTTTGIWTALRAGHYRFDAQLMVTLSAPQACYVMIAVNGTNIAYGLFQLANTNPTSISTGVNSYIEVGDAVSVRVTCASNVSISEDSSIASRFMITRLNGA